MKNVLMSFLFGLLVLATACTPAETNEAMDEVVDEATESVEAMSEAVSGDSDEQVVASTESYKTVITEGGIASPRKEMSGSIGDAEITLDYGSPSVKGRDIWGGLNPFGEVWRAGANAATTIAFSEDVTIEGEALPAGKYALFTIPNKDNVVVIFNSETDQWGAGNYDESKDVLRVTVTPSAVDENQEALEYMVDGDQVVLAWANWRIPFTVSTSAE
ncbi:MAG TPA: DUF2911 domain-containing protein [Saprospiraceae bacterium]|nr:DUF2911 domain-containing protein [Saprospiraceae bacterium]